MKRKKGESHFSVVPIDNLSVKNGKKAHTMPTFATFTFSYAEMKGSRRRSDAPFVTGTRTLPASREVAVRFGSEKTEYCGQR